MSNLIKMGTYLIKCPTLRKLTELLNQIKQEML